ncbi:hypothetical protein BEP19_13000 [Ammoniphilus oxalaticus]|uniref:Uncharacterized protein n=1 Tax=Ammoniphilus oxalaticus TaxID=66863 RepID=A0A419SH42_9BACL|nr:hypothetical protein [Ammoniphilus oxalaticus]RKD23131.1 hypothetical protein BEP19_13000 [Ammoniphilus oxalaticus]
MESCLVGDQFVGGQSLLGGGRRWGERLLLQGGGTISGRGRVAFLVVGTSRFLKWVNFEASSYLFY